MSRRILTIPAKKRIALIAHDQLKKDMIDWCARHRAELMNHTLCGTGTTAGLITRTAGIPVEGYRSGPLGGDLQIGAEIAAGRIDLVIFLCDPLTAQPHDPDVKALLRITQVYGVPIATNLATADFIITSPLMAVPYDREVMDFDRSVAERTDAMAQDQAL